MKTLGLTRRDFASCGNPAHVVWWIDDDTRHYTALLAGEVDDLPLPEQPRMYGPYLCSGPGPLPAYIEVRLGWHHGDERIQVTSYAETSRRIGRWTGGRYAQFDTMPDAIVHAREQVRLLHRWLNSDGTLPLPQVQTYGVSVPQKSPAELRRELARLEAQREALSRQSGQGSKATIAARNARRDWIGDRLHTIRKELEATA